METIISESNNKSSLILQEKTYINSILLTQNAYNNYAEMKLELSTGDNRKFSFSDFSLSSEILNRCFNPINTNKMVTFSVEIPILTKDEFKAEFERKKQINQLKIDINNLETKLKALESLDR